MMTALDTTAAGSSNPALLWPLAEERVAEASVHLRVDCLSKSWGKSHPILDQISFSVGKGKATVLIGHNGSGKSSLLRCCLRLIEPSSGSIRLFDRRITGVPRSRIRDVCARVGFIFQRHNLVPRLSVLTNVLHGAQARKQGPRVWFQALASREDRELAMQCLDRVGLAHLAERRADRLSGGESQRVAIARALMQAPKMLMADEPVASLDPQAGEEVMELFRTLQQEEGLTLLFVSHNLEHALRYSDHILGLRKGRLVLDTPAVQETDASLRDLFA